MAPSTEIAPMFNWRSIGRFPNVRAWAPPLVLFIALVVSWEWICQFFGVKEYVLPAPTDIAAQIAANYTRLFWHTSLTLMGAAAGFIVANTLSLVVAIAFTQSPLFERSTYPYLVALKAVPIVAVAPLIGLWLGDGFGSKVAMAALITFFPMVVNATLGLKSVDRRALDLMKVLGATDQQVFRKLRIPGAIPYVASALKISAPLAVVGAIVAEIAGASSGIGYLILVAAYKVETPFMFACVVFAAAAGLGFFGMAVYIEKRLTASGPRRRNAAKTAVDLLRIGRLPSSELTNQLAGPGVGDALNKLILPADESALLRWLAVPEAKTRNAALLMSSPLLRSGAHWELFSAAWHIWETTIDQETKRTLCWALTECPNLSASQYGAILEFVRQDWHEFQQHALKLNGGAPAGICEVVRSRWDQALSQDPSPPRQSAWIHLIAASLDPDKNRVLKFVQPFLGSNEPAVAQVALQIVNNRGNFLESRS